MLTKKRGSIFNRPQKPILTRDWIINFGQLVFLRNGVWGWNKIQDAWSSTLYIMTELPAEKDGVVYTVELADGSGNIGQFYCITMQICPSELEFYQPIRPVRIPRKHSREMEDTDSETEEIAFPVTQSQPEHNAKNVSDNLVIWCCWDS